MGRIASDKANMKTKGMEGVRERLDTALGEMIKIRSKELIEDIQDRLEILKSDKRKQSLLMPGKTDMERQQVNIVLYIVQ